MTRIYIVVVSFLFLLACHTEEPTLMPLPTDGEVIIKEDMEDPEKKTLKDAWKAKLFATPDGIDAEYIELQNSYRRFQQRNTAVKPRTNEEIIANGLITGKWAERGSINQSGSVFVTEYDQDTKDLYLISAGGHLWRGGLDGLSWQVINDRARFHNQFLDIVTLENGDKRMLAAISNEPHYSDDMGLSWIPSEGFTALQYARIKNSFTSDDENGYTFFLGQSNYNENLGLYVSKDKGETYELAHQFNTSDRRNLALSITKNSNEVLVVEQLSDSSTRLYTYDDELSNLQIVQDMMPLSYNQGSGSFVSTFSNGTTYMYLLEEYYDNALEIRRARVHVSLDYGQTWELKNDLPSIPWGVGIFVSAENPNFLMYGDIECYRTMDGGNTWTKFNGWAEYYSDVLNNLHADMMYFSEYIDEETEEHFMLISHHGGISKLLDYEATPINIALTGLNVSQYYSVRSSPDEKWIYAGSQDQGFQRGMDDEGEIVDLFQAISGDYGHIVFTEDKNLWTVYPGGWVTYWPNPTGGGIVSSFELESDDESVWIPPLYSTQDLGVNQIFMAGGNINGGGGSHLIRLFAGGDQIQPTQFDFDFKEASNGGHLSAIATGDDYEDIIYCATDNGQFFYSTDGGENFTKTANVNGGHYLYGQVIVPSKNNNQLIYTGGNGYNGVPVMKSEDGGVTFSPYGEGLPNTTVLGMTMNKEESLIFAATSSGPYVCVVSQDLWYDMSGEAAPDVAYWSVELIHDDQTVRFGTYGRGIFDFNILQFTSNEESEDSEEVQIKVYPNPVTDFVNIEWPDKQVHDAAIFDLNGTIVRSIELNRSNTNSISLAGLQAGQYFLRYSLANSTHSQSIIKI